MGGARLPLSILSEFPKPPLTGPAEAEQLLEACDEWLKPIVTAALHTGMRKSELLGLTWDCIDLTHGFIRLKQTKNGTARGIPFNETLWSPGNNRPLKRFLTNPSTVSICRINFRTKE
jgi:integrase